MVNGVVVVGAVAVPNANALVHCATHIASKSKIATSTSAMDLICRMNCFTLIPFLESLFLFSDEGSRLNVFRFETH